MTNIDPALPAGGIVGGVVGIATVAASSTTGAEPWIVVPIITALGGFCAWIIRWILRRSEERDKTQEASARRREQREEKRAEQSELQTEAMQACVTELRLLRDGQMQAATAIQTLPERVVSLIDRRA